MYFFDRAPCLPPLPQLQHLQLHPLSHSPAARRQHDHTDASNDKAAGSEGRSGRVEQFQRRSVLVSQVPNSQLLTHQYNETTEGKEIRHLDLSRHWKLFIRAEDDGKKDEEQYRDFRY